MNDRYGVDPAAATSTLELASLLRQFGPEHGRFIFDFPPNWSEEVGGLRHEARDFERRRIELWMERAKRSLLPTKARYSADLTWAENAAQLVNDARGLIGPSGSKPPCRELEEILVDPKAWADCRGGHVPRTPAAYVEVARPLLQISSKVVLIDPNFHLRFRPRESSTTRRAHRFAEPFTALIEAAKTERKVEVFKLMVSASRAMISEDGGEGFEADLSAILSSVGGNDLEIEYGLLDEGHPLDEHPRYLLGNECGLKFDWGFDMKRGSTNHVEWVGGAALEPLLVRFM